MNTELFDQLAEYARMAYGYEGEITRDTLLSDMGTKSMEMIALASTIENELDAEVTIHEIMTMKTFGELVDRVAEEVEE